MKIKSNVKAGPDYLNHNEKIISDINTIEEKKTLSKKLRLSKETIRELNTSELKIVAGGVRSTWGYTCDHSGCTCFGN